jgi:Protein of unknown function (DUF2442)
MILLMSPTTANTSDKGFSLQLDDEALHVSYADFPWFKKATMEQITSIERPTPDHLYWPMLDIDLSVQSIRVSVNLKKISEFL